MATNMVYKYDERKTRERPVPSGTQSGVALLVGTGDAARPAVTLTARGDATRSATLSGGIVVQYPNGGAGNLPDSATVAFDGTWELSVTGATTTTANEVAVYITSGGTLTTTVGTNTLFGYTDYPRDYVKRAGVAAVRIGA